LSREYRDRIANSSAAVIAHAARGDSGSSAARIGGPVDGVAVLSFPPWTDAERLPLQPRAKLTRRALVQAMLFVAVRGAVNDVASCWRRTGATR
jgi:hypothetical protein